MFNKEADFEKALVDLLLSEKGWQEVLVNHCPIYHPTNLLAFLLASYLHFIEKGWFFAVFIG